MLYCLYYFAVASLSKLLPLHHTLRYVTPDSSLHTSYLPKNGCFSTCRIVAFPFSGLQLISQVFRLIWYLVVFKAPDKLSVPLLLCHLNSIRKAQALKKADRSIWTVYDFDTVLPTIKFPYLWVTTTHLVLHAFHFRVNVWWPFIQLCFFPPRLYFLSFQKKKKKLGILVLWNKFENGHPCHVPNLRKKIFQVFTIEQDVSCGFLICGLLLY